MNISFNLFDTKLEDTLFVEDIVWNISSCTHFGKKKKVLRCRFSILFILLDKTLQNKLDSKKDKYPHLTICNSPKVSRLTIHLTEEWKIYISIIIILRMKSSTSNCEEKLCFWEVVDCCNVTFLMRKVTWYLSNCVLSQQKNNHW